MKLTFRKWKFWVVSQC